MQTQNPAKRLKSSSSAFSPYDRKEAQKEKMLEDIISKPVNIKEMMILNPYLTSPAPEISSSPLCESKSFDFEDMKTRRIVIDGVITAIGWKEFCEIDEPAKDFPVTALKNEYKILHNLCTHSLLPRSRNRYRVHDIDLMILHYLTLGQRINFPYLIIRHIIAALKDTSRNGGLPYSMALTKVFKEFKLSFIGALLYGLNQSFQGIQTLLHRRKSHRKSEAIQL
ncbi:hypothetical protein MTR_7g037770 [Medicago truncatula]|uniref:Uncharacterized protein n=1 Tax=Medicago truncatula TaxID=3880 RepID=G7KS46_MEDTR|nr:hypothetical protein MTR_7g037770 [Medicago truncatula]